LFFIFILSFVSQGEFFKEGDIVSVTDVGGDIFYAQLRGFLTDEYGEKSGVIRYNHAGFQAVLGIRDIFCADHDPTPDLTTFFSDLKDAKKEFFLHIFSHNLPVCTLSSVLNI
jgi:hypothetical protein